MTPHTTPADAPAVDAAGQVAVVAALSAVLGAAALSHLPGCTWFLFRDGAEVIGQLVPDDTAGLTDYAAVLGAAVDWSPNEGMSPRTRTDINGVTVVIWTPMTAPDGGER